MKRAGIVATSVFLITATLFAAVDQFVTPSGWYGIQRSLSRARLEVDTSAVASKNSVTNLTATVAAKQPTVTGAASTITTSNLTVNTAVVSDASGKIAVQTGVSNTEVSYLDGVTSAIQTQINTKAPTASPTFTGTVTVPTPFTLGATSVTADGTELNYVDGVTSAIQTQLNTKEATANKGTANGYAGLDANSKVATTNLGTGVADKYNVLMGDQTFDVPAFRHQMRGFVARATTTSIYNTLNSAPTLNATVTNVDDAVSPCLNFASGAVIGNTSGITGGSSLMRQWAPYISFRIRTVDVTNCRIWVALSSADPSGTGIPNQHLMGFRYDTVLDGTAFWRAVTIAGTGAVANVTTTTQSIATNTNYEMRIRANTTDDSVFFYIGVDGAIPALVATHTTTLPTATTVILEYYRVTTLENVAKNIRFRECLWIFE